ncbi:hypothetical protein [Aquibaculum arenosum]|uniref:Uncharacterized protein n=1 Tax=Aquibaculum arenosum TaxID=3032591 RepID=A0ABT5YLP5_9PROT|nr:hypothetical protein [Fodinicurvata sp. CAU 1616]MDF2095184.1 hypothetical protein [Fodinicurvata sp. CAU 1616]
MSVLVDGHNAVATGHDNALIDDGRPTGTGNTQAYYALISVILLQCILFGVVRLRCPLPEAMG